MAERHEPVRLWPRVVATAWGWRFEATLWVATMAGLHLAGRLGPGGGVLAAGLVVVAVWRSDPLRRWLVDRTSRAAICRRFARALVACGLTDPLGIVLIRGVEPLPIGVRLVVRVPTGLDVSAFEAAAPKLAAFLRAREVRVVRDATDASLAYVDVVVRDPLGGDPFPWQLVRAAKVSLWEPVPVGVGELGQVISIGLPEHNLLLGGEPGAGKSAVLSLLVAAAALDPSVSLTLLDAKEVELAPWAGCADHFVGVDVVRATEVLDGLRSEMDTRYARLLAEGRRKVAPGDGLGLRLVAIDELAFYLRTPKKAERDVFTEALRDLVSRGRAAGIIVVAATQKPSHEVVPTWIRDLFSYRFALRCTTPEASDTILGQGWAAQGASAATIDPAQRGVGYLLAEGGVPIKARAAYLTDADITIIARRATRLRGLS